MHVGKKLWSLVALGVLVAGFLIYRYLLSSMTLFDCQHHVLSEAASPDGQYVATVSERNCGAVTDYYRVVSIRPREVPFDGENTRSWIFSDEHQPEIKAVWSGKRQLTVLYSSNTGRQKEVKQWNDVVVTALQSH
jgi:hypothetical protein